MTALLWPGDHRAGALFDDAAVLAAMVQVERAWLQALVSLGVAPDKAADELDGLVGADDLSGLTAAGEAGGNPVIPLLALLRERLDSPQAARWLHRGLTSQDVLDTALVLCARDATRQVLAECAAQVDSLATLADTHRATPMVARTLTQHAVPISFGAKVASWLHGVLDAADDVRALTFPAQFGGAAGTLSAATALTGDRVRARRLASIASVELGLADREPWHTARAPITRIGAALTGACAAWGRIANDVLVLARPEIGELAEPLVDGRGGSSAMPQKANPVLSVLIRRTALAAPAQLAQLTLAAAEAHDERPAGSWHLEWPALQSLGRQSAAAAAQTSELVGGLRVDVERMATNLAAGRDINAEQRSAAELSGHHDVGGYGTINLQIDAVCTRAHAWLDGHR
ncbi:lyase family protein [uncultured Jatrophihabitans sp.]|uniref:lyase family protein n=1 Tax=uncultured Jatrophihabitans sp. TaxID=1610747 RepID=UPI0035CADDED